MRPACYRVPWLSLLLVLDLSSITANAQTLCGTLAIAHRGNSFIAPENTLAAIASTVDQAHLVEFDVRQCATGELVLMHDATVDRTTDGTGNVADLSLAQLKSLDAGSWFSPDFADERIPTLAEALSSLPSDVRPLIHHYTGSAETYLAELEALDVQGVIFQSFNWAFLEAAHDLEDDIQLAALGVGLITNEVIDDIMITGSNVVAWRSSDVDDLALELVHDAGLALYVWTVNDIADIEAWIALDVDGIIADDPDLVFQRSIPWYINGDVDMNDVADLEDHAVLVDCFTGPNIPIPEGCGVFDFDCDGDVDLHDVAGMENAFE